MGETAAHPRRTASTAVAEVAEVAEPAESAEEGRPVDYFYPRERVVGTPAWTGEGKRSYHPGRAEMGKEAAG